MGTRFLPKDITATEAGKISMIVDHLVDAVGGDPSVPLRRMAVLVDIDQHPGVTQTEVMKRLNIDKSSMNRDVEWLCDHGCIIRNKGRTDGRELPLNTIAFARHHIGIALEYFQGSHEHLKEFLRLYDALFGKHKATLRDARIVSALGELGKARKQDLLGELYGGPVSTDSRAFQILEHLGVIEKI